MVLIPVGAVRAAAVCGSWGCHIECSEHGALGNIFNMVTPGAILGRNRCGP